MNRLLEPELMEDETHVKAYAEADFEIRIINLYNG